MRRDYSSNPLGVLWLDHFPHTGQESAGRPCLSPTHERFCMPFLTMRNSVPINVMEVSHALPHTKKRMQPADHPRPVPLTFRM